MREEVTRQVFGFFSLPFLSCDGIHPVARTVGMVVSGGAVEEPDRSSLISGLKTISSLLSYSDEIPDLQLTERILRGFPNAGQLIAIIPRS